MGTAQRVEARYRGGHATTDTEARIEKLKSGNDAEGLIQIMREELTSKRAAADALFDLPDSATVASPLVSFLRDRPALVSRWEKEWRDFQSGSGIAWADHEFRDMAESDMVHIEYGAIRLFRSAANSDGLQLLASSSADSDVREDATTALGQLA